ncbi:hypothetical protein XA68_17639 [Ophiocordyceps unilateralis]|uniref:Methyltransferase domain-containing protein n=1 Tax=Ophiocordyceps unilateralis TaxID=268505 RepID=A0A2A9PKB3_OPHUN|nr:hypothetical protein XA68_17639 [Ophiocordyceps unilateralis]
MAARASRRLEGFEFTFECYAGEEQSPESSVSLSESVQAFPEEFGRTYHAYRAGSYAFPNDALERDRLALQGEALRRLLNGRLFLAPLSTPRMMLDIATGIGDWAIQMGDLFPDAHVIATDLSPIQPEQVPPNVSFFVEDSSDPWEYSDRFDYIHTRATAGCWADFESQIAHQAFQALQPGGWFEAQELDSVVESDDGTLDRAGPLATWFHELAVAGERCHRPFILGGTLCDVLRRVGFVDVHHRIFKIPLNPWAKDEAIRELGRMWEKNILTGLSGFSLRIFNRVYGRSPAEIEVRETLRPSFFPPPFSTPLSLLFFWGGGGVFLRSTCLY